MGKKSATARQREAQEARRKKILRLVAIGAAVVVVVAAIALIVYFVVYRDSSPSATELVIEDLVVGTGEEAQANDVVTVNYTVWLEDGTQVDSSVGGAPFTFILGTGRVIEGWDQGIVGMKVGGTRRLTIPPDLGYGNEAFKEVPANSTLVCEVELVAVE